jgi:adenylylsulfate kinase-like enzyme
LSSLVDGLSRFIMTTIGGEGSAEVQANPLTKTCQSVDPQNQCKEADEGEISNNMTEVQNPYKLPLNPELLTVFTEKPDESVNSVVGYQYSFEDNNR